MQARDVIVARRERDYVNTGRLHEAVAKSVVSAVVGSTPGAKKGAGEKAAKGVDFFAQHRKTRRREVSIEQAVAVFGQPLVPEEVSADG